RMRREGPLPGTNPRCGGSAGPRAGIRRRVTVPCTATRGNRTSEPRRPVVNLARDRVLLKRGNAYPRTAVGCSCSLAAILITTALRIGETKAALRRLKPSLQRASHCQNNLRRTPPTGDVTASARPAQHAIEKVRAAQMVLLGGNCTWQSPSKIPAPLNK